MSKVIQRCSVWVIAAAVLVLQGCASVKTADPRDPWESMNRSIYQFNDAVDTVAIKPAAEVYVKVLPSFVRTGVHNFLGNLSDVWSMANSAMQLKGQATAETFMRITVNTFLGLGGVLDVATEMRLEKRKEDFGQTLGYWGVKPGPYVVLPLLGPSTFRDAPARFVDAPLDPLYHYDDVRVRNSLLVVNVVNTRARLLPATDLVERIALDQYAFVRDAYLQRRASLIRDGAPDPDEQIYEDYEEDKPRSEAPQDFPPFKAALLKTAPAQTQLDANIPGDLEQSERARNGLGLLN